MGVEPFTYLKKNQAFNQCTTLLQMHKIWQHIIMNTWLFHIFLHFLLRTIWSYWLWLGRWSIFDTSTYKLPTYLLTYLLINYLATFIFTSYITINCQPPIYLKPTYLQLIPYEHGISFGWFSIWSNGDVWFKWEFGDLLNSDIFQIYHWFSMIGQNMNFMMFTWSLWLHNHVIMTM